MANEEAGVGINVNSLSVCYGNSPAILEDLSLRVAPGEIVALLGVSGSGKSTLLRTLAGLLPVQRGSVDMGISDVAPHSSPAEVGFVFQDATLLPWRTVEANVRLPFELGSQASRQRQEGKPEDIAHRVERAIASVGLDAEAARKFPRELSGGMRMRASLARAIVTDPSVLLLDEPFGALDDILRTRMNQLLLTLHEARRRTVVFVTHNIAEAIFLSHRVVILGGRKISEVVDNPLPFPRTEALRSSLEFAECYGQVSAALARAGK